MEGRAIARPNKRCALRRCQTAARRPASMEGRAIARPNPARHTAYPSPSLENASMEGRAIARPNLASRPTAGTLVPATAASMEGRAIARPNHFSTAIADSQRRAPVASMEGRAIARPNLRSVDDFEDCRMLSASMEGRAIARPNLSRASNGPPCSTLTVASMEGRAIARPNTGLHCTSHRDPLCFNGGPGNCPAQTSTPSSTPPRQQPLQWRAGQLPGQTVGDAADKADRGDRRFNGGPGNCPAKRPCTRPPSGGSARMGFNGGPGNCPAKRCSMLLDVLAWYAGQLQWRAGQLPGQTRIQRWTRALHRSRDLLQWRAGQLPGQTRPPDAGDQLRLRVSAASMEGRAIARPNSGMLGCDRLGARHRASMEGRAIARPNSATPVRQCASRPRIRFNGGPGNCPAKPGTHTSGDDAR